ncbi:MAG: hypothetical protein H6718_21735 [Polyangiaceae bacterium]|nr:hypothetical protein [Myxococcales bacterium]MCB9588043.1 hypothetical protein [Polyangiaceae bacterium]MCB9610648.1 hypothetical protein [Polyangiaceae bacterium]
MTLRWTPVFALSFVCVGAAYGCNSKPAQDPDAAQPLPTTEVTAPTPSAAPSATEEPVPSAEPSSNPPEDAGPPGEEFTQCPPRKPDAGPVMCTKEYMPVCGLVDTGVRCITTPCPSATKKTFGNKCEACGAQKVIGYTKGACEEAAKTK